jgi:hypothetical protein
MEGKTILKVLGGAAVLSTLFAFKKKNDFSKVMEAMTIDVRNIRKLRLSGGKMYVNIDLGFHNPTQYDMVILTAGTIKVTQISLLYKGVLIGNAYSSKTEFELPAKSNYLITDIAVELLFLNIIDQYMKGGLDANMDNYQIHTVVEALGKSWIIEQ